MSLFLGKIHYWLYNKIVWFEGLENEIIEIAKSEELDFETINKEIVEKYGEKLPQKPLEDIIDKGNIHGWLQSKINSAEGRIAAWTAVIINNSEQSIEKLYEVYKKQGIKAAKEVMAAGKVIESPEALFNIMNDYILDGMPCDRVNIVTETSDDTIKWTKRLCVHKDIWDKEEIDVKYFYDLRKVWIENFITEINCNFKYLELNENERCITRV